MSITKQAFSQNYLKRLICAAKKDKFRTNHTFHVKIVVIIFIVCYTILAKIGLLQPKVQHNVDYVIAAVFGGYFYIINRIFSIR